jgi:hypothetical protein
VENFGIKNPYDVPQVEVAVSDLCHVLPAHVAEVAFFAFGHDGSIVVSG